MVEATILAVDDEPRLLRLVNEVLTAVGYRVVTANNGESALEAVALEQPDLILLDIRLPHGIDGYQVCRRVREFSDVPVIMLTAKARENDLLRGFDAGADDYLTKPFSMRELLARVKALLRRVRLDREELAEEAPAERLTFRDLIIDPARREVLRKGGPLPLKPKEYELLLFLARNRGIVLSRDLILERVWGWDFDGGSRTVDVHVRWLREKIEPDPARPTRIVTVRGVGYRFEG